MKGDAEQKSIEGRTDDLNQKKPDQWRKTRFHQNLLNQSVTDEEKVCSGLAISFFFFLLAVGTEWTIGRRFHRPEK